MGASQSALQQSFHPTHVRFMRSTKTLTLLGKLDSGEHGTMSFRKTTKTEVKKRCMDNNLGSFVMGVVEFVPEDAPKTSLAGAAQDLTTPPELLDEESESEAAPDERVVESATESDSESEEEEEAKEEPIKLREEHSSFAVDINLYGSLDDVPDLRRYAQIAGGFKYHKARMPLPALVWASALGALTAIV